MKLLDIHSITSAPQALSWWLVHGYLYHVVDRPLLTDADWHTLSGWLRAAWGTFDHIHAHLVTPDDLRASSGAGIAYPLRVREAANWLLREIDRPASKQNCGHPKRKISVTKSETYKEFEGLFT